MEISIQTNRSFMPSVKKLLKLLLCQSYLGPKSGQPLVFPLGLSYLASMVKEKHEVFCWDPNVSENPMKELTTLLLKVEPDVVGVSFRNIDSIFSFNRRSYYDPFVSMIRVIRENAPSCVLIVGGYGFSLFAEEIMNRNPEIDIGLVSEGELAFAELMENLGHPENVKNLIIRKGGKLFFTGRSAWANFGLLPFPSREFFDIEKYLGSPYSFGVNTSRGCGYGCIFCPIKVIMGDSFRLRSPKNVVDEIEVLINHFGITSFNFADELFIPPDHSRGICREIIKRKLDITWQAAFHPLFINKPLMEEAVRAGCTLFDFSPDGASNNALRFLGKNFSVDHVDKTIALASKMEGANVAYSFFYDLPNYNDEHVKGLMRLIPKMMVILRSKLRFISLTKLRIYPYTQVYEIAMKEGKIDALTDLIYPVFYESSASPNLANSLVTALWGSSILFRKVFQKK